MPKKPGSSSQPPWARPNPKASKGASTHLTEEQKAEAKRRAAKAGRPYPNLVDNMAVARMARKASPSKGGKRSGPPESIE